MTITERYHQPESLEKAIALRTKIPDCRIISEIFLLISGNKDFTDSYVNILDLSEVKELDFIVEDHAAYYIGMGTKIETFREYFKERYPALVSEPEGNSTLSARVTIKGLYEQRMADIRNFSLLPGEMLMMIVISKTENT